MPKKDVKGGAQFDIGVNEAKDVDQLLETYLPALERKYANFIRALANACIAEKTDTVTAHTLAQYADVSRSTIDVYSESLTKRGIFFKASIRKEGKGRKPNIYTLNELELIVNEDDDLDLLPTQTLIGYPTQQQDQQLGLFSAESLPAPSVYEEVWMPGNVLKAEILSIYTFLSALRLSNSGERTTGSYVADVYISNRDRMKIQVAATEGYKVAGIIDTKALIAITTKARHIYPLIDNEDELPPQSQPIIMDMHELLTILDFGTTGAEKKQAWKMVLAWTYTRFTILRTNRVVQSLFGEEFLKFTTFSFISRAEAIKSERAEYPEKFAVWLDPKFLLRILHRDSKFVSSVTNQIMGESSASVLMLYYWCRRAIQYHTDPNTAATFSEQQLKQQMANYMYDSTFRRVLDTICRRTQYTDDLYNVYGYRFKRWSTTSAVDSDDGKPKTTYFYQFWLDKKDSLAVSRARYPAVNTIEHTP